MGRVKGGRERREGVVEYDIELLRSPEEEVVELSPVFEHAVLEGSVVGGLVGSGVEAHRTVAAVHVPASCTAWRGGGEEVEGYGSVIE